jgi:UrcA family protein
MDMRFLKTPNGAIGVLLVAASFALPVTPVLADEPALPTVHVPYGDLDLARQADVNLLNRRIGRAVRKVCPGENSVSLASQQAAFHCRQVAMQSATMQRDHAVAAARSRAVEFAAR